MDFNSSCDQTNFLGYHPPSQISNGGWEYHQEFTDSKHSNPWRCTSKPQDEQDNHMGYFSPPQNDSYHYPHGGWEYYQGMKEHPPSRPSFSFESSSSLNYASTQSFHQNPYKSSHQSHNSFHTPQHNFTTTYPRHQNYSQPSSLEPPDEDYLQAIEIHRKLVERYTQPQSWKEIIFNKMNGPLEQTRRSVEPLSKENEGQLMDVKEKVEEQDKEATASSELSMKNAVVENGTALEVTREEVEDQESEEDTQEKSPSIEAESCIEEGFMEPPIQEALNEEITPIITQQPYLDIQEVKAINKNTKKKIVTKIPRTTFKRRSTANNPPPDSASKINQANFTRKLAERRPRQGTIAETSLLLKSFLLTNWKKRKKVNNR
ncbi:hypothetical protein AHAS_Ahas10G0132700 [Arachis hypogaea]